MDADQESGMRHVPFAELVALLVPIFERHRCSPEVAAVLAENCASAERDGQASHGLFRMPGYVSTLKSGWVDGRAVPRVEDAAPGFVRVDAMNGFTQVALRAARPLLVEKARANGVAVLAIRNSHHLAALALDVEPFAEDGFVALSVINSMLAVVPHGGHSPVFGTNPIAFAAPSASGPPFVFDLATSTMANGDVRIAAREGRTVPPGTGIDRDGQPTTDPNAILDGGALLPFGGHKGSALSMMVEILCAALVGAKFSHEVDLSRHPGAMTPHTGQTILLIDPATGADGLPPLAARVDALVAAVREAGADRLPGDRRHAARERAASTGIPVSESTLTILNDLLAD